MRKWYTNGVDNKLIDLSKSGDIPNGFYPGRSGVKPIVMTDEIKQKISSSCKGREPSNKGKKLDVKRVCYTNGVSNKYLKEDDIIPDGFYKGCTSMMTEDGKKRRV